MTDPACQISPTWVRPNTTQSNEQKEQKHTPKQIGMDMESPVLVDFADLLGPAIWVLQVTYLIYPKKPNIRAVLHSLHV